METTLATSVFLAISFSAFLNPSDKIKDKFKVPKLPSVYYVHGDESFENGEWLDKVFNYTRFECIYVNIFFTRFECIYVNIFFTRFECSFVNIFFTRFECNFVNIFFTRLECSFRLYLKMF